MCRRGYDGRSLKLDMINLNQTSSWFHSDELEVSFLVSPFFIGDTSHNDTVTGYSP